MDVVELDKELQTHITQLIDGIRLAPFINFKSACNYELEFLKDVELGRDIYYDAEYLEISVRRYERYWLPLLASLTTENDTPSVGSTNTSDINKPLNGFTKMIYAPPTDIHWVWHVHMLAPVSYIADCKVNHTFSNK